MNKFIDSARHYLGTPFHHHGRLKGIGVDCLGLILCAASDSGIPLRENFGYGQNPGRNTAATGLSEQLDEMELCEAAAGDVLLCWVGNPKISQHMLIATDISTVIHCTPDHGVIEDRFDDNWASRVTKCFRLRNIVAGELIKWPVKYMPEKTCGCC